MRSFEGFLLIWAKEKTKWWLFFSIINTTFCKVMFLGSVKLQQIGIWRNFFWSIREIFKPWNLPFYSHLFTLFTAHSLDLFSIGREVKLAFIKSFKLLNRKATETISNLVDEQKSDTSSLSLAIVNATIPT